MDPAPRPRSRAAAGLPPITPEQIVDVALRLTATHGVRGWSIRMLAANLDVGAAVVYHRVGHRQDVVLEVARRVAALIPLPPPDLPWREWFVVLLGNLRRVALRHPGIAREMVVFGPAVDTGGIIDAGIRVLDDAGFGDEAALVFSYLLNTALHLIAVEDERDASPAVRLDNARRIVDLAEEPGHAGLAAMADWLKVRSENLDQLRARDAEFFRYCVERSLDGAKARLAVVRRRPRSTQRSRSAQR